MPRFEVHALEMRRRHYLLLPKLNREQRALLTGRLLKEGFALGGGEPLTFRSGWGAIHVYAEGFCWGSSDPSDFILPAVPELLGCRQERVSRRDLRRMYFQVSSATPCAAMRLTPRVESAGNWEALRATDECGVSPDERLAFQAVLEEADIAAAFVTDFAGAGSTPMVIGRRLYFRTKMTPAAASRALRSAGSKRQRNAYLSRDGRLTVSARGEFQRAFDAVAGELGEWCSFRAE